MYFLKVWHFYGENSKLLFFTFLIEPPVNIFVKHVREKDPYTA